jgi:hypothetical protein
MICKIFKYLIYVFLLVLAVNCEGAARFFSGSEFNINKPHDFNKLSVALKKRLLDHMLGTSNSNNIERVRAAFE